MKGKIKVAQFGLGPIGLECIKLAATKPWAQVVGAIDIDPAKRGQDLGQLIGTNSLVGLRIVGALEELKTSPDVIFHTAASRFRTAAAHIEPMVRKGIDVVSSCEELIFPYLSEPELAAGLDKTCRKSGARVVGTGVNPGFVMDVLPLFLTGVVREIRAIHVQRVVDASTRREPLQRKIGSGLAPGEFRRRFRAGNAGHAGLKESLGLIAHTLGWKTDKIQEQGEPVVARGAIRTRFLEVRKGQTCGLHQRAEARIGGRVRLTLDLKMYLGAEDPQDAIQIDGDPPLDLVIRGGVAGDQATVAVLVNAVPRLRRLQPGLKLLTDLPVM